MISEKELAKLSYPEAPKMVSGQVAGPKKEVMRFSRPYIRRKEKLPFLADGGLVGQHGRGI